MARLERCWHAVAGGVTGGKPTPHGDLPLTPLARLLIGRVPPGIAVQRYGTPEWFDLAEQDPRRAAAVVIAAEAWRRHCDLRQVARDVAEQLAIDDRLVYERVRGVSADISAGTDWRAVAVSPSWDELCARRGEPERMRGRRPATHQPRRAAS